MFQCLPTYQYRIREEGRQITTHANLTRGQFNACETGRFIGYIHTLNHKNIEILVACKNPKCDTHPYWAPLDDLDEAGELNCDFCEKPCPPVTNS